MGGNFTIAEGPTTPGPFAPGLTRNEGTIPGVGVAMPLSIPSLDMPQGEQKQPHPVSMGAPPLPPGPHPSLLNANQQQPYQQNPQQMPQHQHQALPQQMGSLPMPPNMQQLQHPSHSPFPNMPRPPPQMPIGMPGSIPGISSVPTSHPMPMPGPMVQILWNFSLIPIFPTKYGKVMWIYLLPEVIDCLSVVLVVAVGGWIFNVFVDLSLA